MAFLAGAGLPGLALFAGTLVDAGSPKLNEAEIQKRIFPTFGILEGVAIGSCLLSSTAWYFLNKTSTAQSNRLI
jgi:hypothetical protein